jgi:hypothetical protein
MVNKEYYLKVINRLREEKRRKWSDLWRGEKWLLNHDNILLDSFLLIRDFLTQHGWHSSPSLCTHQTLHQHTSFCLPSWNPYWKDYDLSLFRRVKKIHWQSYTVLQKRHSRNASERGLNAS